MLLSTSSSDLELLVVLLLFLVATTIPAQCHGPAAGDGITSNCSRFCDDASFSTRRCRYEFFIDEFIDTYSNCNGTWPSVETPESTCREKESREERNFLTVNGRSPGPAIEVCLGDTIEVILHNRLGTSEVSLHWHGVSQRGTVHMDGVPMVTQCPILPYSGFRYEFEPEKAGTYFYHAHSVFQQSDGIYGSLIVRGPTEDPAIEKMLLLSSRTATPLTRHSHVDPPVPSELLLNGQRGGSIVHVNHGRQYRLRLINGNAFNCPMLMSLGGHVFRVSTVDGEPVLPVEGTSIVLFPGTQR